MPSLSNIPEPTTAHRPITDEPEPPGLPPMIPRPEADDAPPHLKAGATRGEPDDPQQQMDSVLCLMLLLIAGGLLRLVLGFFGPVQGVNTAQYEQLTQQGKAIFAGKPSTPYPLLDALLAGLSQIGGAGWLAVAIGALLTLAAVPAAYKVGRALTQRRVVGVVAAALVAVHPGVLTASNSLSGVAFAMGLGTIGLALVSFAPKRGVSYALGGVVALALAGLAAPLGWVFTPIAALLVCKLSTEESGLSKGISHALLVLVVGLGPIVGYRAAFMGIDAQGLAPEFAAPHNSGDEVDPTSRFLITMTDPSLKEMGELLHLPLGNAGQITMLKVDPPSELDDPVADVLADSWLLMNAALAGLAAVSVGVMLLRRRFVEVLILTTPVIAISLSTLRPTEMLRLPMLPLIGVLAVGLFATRAVRALDEAALAEKAQRKAAKQAKKQEKDRARQEHGAQKQKQNLYAFDKPSRAERKARKKRAQANAKPTNPTGNKTDKQPEQPTGILTERVAEDETAVPARPI